MSKEFPKFGPHFRRSTTEILLRQRVEPLCMRLIVESIFPRTLKLNCLNCLTTGFIARQGMPVACSYRLAPKQLYSKVRYADPPWNRSNRFGNRRDTIVRAYFRCSRPR